MCGMILHTLQSFSNIAANAQTNPSPSNANGIFYITKFKWVIIQNIILRYLRIVVKPIIEVTDCGLWIRRRVSSTNGNHILACQQDITRAAKTVQPAPALLTSQRPQAYHESGESLATSASCHAQRSPAAWLRAAQRQIARRRRYVPSLFLLIDLVATNWPTILVIGHFVVRATRKEE